MGVVVARVMRRRGRKGGEGVREARHRGGRCLSAERLLLYETGEERRRGESRGEEE